MSLPIMVGGVRREAEPSSLANNVLTWSFAVVAICVVILDKSPAAFMAACVATSVKTVTPTLALSLSVGTIARIFCVAGNGILAFLASSKYVAPCAPSTPWTSTTTGSEVFVAVNVAIPVLPVLPLPKVAPVLAFFNTTLAFKILPKEGVTVTCVVCTTAGIAALSSSLLLQAANIKPANKVKPPPNKWDLFIFYLHVVLSYCYIRLKTKSI